jgi:hypothetical protein
VILNYTSVTDRQKRKERNDAGKDKKKLDVWGLRETGRKVIKRKTVYNNLPAELSTAVNIRNSLSLIRVPSHLLTS